jgi:hypothetical protein
MPGKVTCEKLHYSAETVGNLTRTHIEAHLKMDDGSDKIFEGKGQPVFPKFSSSTAMAWKTSDHDKWHGEHTVSCEVTLWRRQFGVSKGKWRECNETQV